MLTDGTLLVPWMVSILRHQSQTPQHGRRESVEQAISGVVNSVVAGVSSPPPATGRQDSKGKGKARSHDQPHSDPVWIICSVGEETTAEDSESAAANQQQITPLKGFDRLREAGISEEDIESIRSHFHASGGVGASAPADPGAAGITTISGRLFPNVSALDGFSKQVRRTDEDEHARALEEQWMEGLATGDGAPADSVDALGQQAGMYKTLFFGLLIGFCFPLLPFFWFKKHGVFDKRQQMVSVATLSLSRPVPRSRSEH